MTFVFEAWMVGVLALALALPSVAVCVASFLWYRVSKAVKDNEKLRESARRRESWLSRAKAEAGYHEHVSFDIVWERTLARAMAADAPVARRRGAANEVSGAASDCDDGGSRGDSSGGRD